MLVLVGHDETASDLAIYWVGSHQVRVAWLVYDIIVRKIGLIIVNDIYDLLYADSK